MAEQAKPFPDTAATQPCGRVESVSVVRVLPLLLGRRIVSRLVVLVIWGSAACAFADKPATTHRLNPIVITSPRRPVTLDLVPMAVSVIDQATIQRARPSLTLDEALSGVPGLIVQNRYNFAQDVRISIRGFGTRAAFGIRGVKLLVDGIPETLPDGQSQVDNLDLGSTTRIEVIRGVASTLYGNAAGGIIALTTESGPETPFFDLRSTFGSYGLRKYQAKVGGQTRSLNYLLNVSRLELEGFRAHSRTENLLLNGKLRQTFDDVSELTTVFNFVHSPVAMDPGALTADEMARDRAQASARNIALDAGESITQGRVGTAYRRTLGDVGTFTARVYGLFRDFAQRLPIDRAIDFDRFSAGGGLRLHTRDESLGIPMRWTVGIDVQYQDDDRRNFNNPAGRPGETLKLHQTERVSSAGAYVVEESRLSNWLRVTLGGRYDRLRFRVKDRLLSDGDDSGERLFSAFSPSLGVLWTPTATVNLYANIATAYETPTTTELANRPSGAGGFNSELRPQRAVSSEVGAKGTTRRLRYGVALFWIDVEDELIPFEVESAPGRRFFRNAGSSTHRGVEASVLTELATGLTGSLAYSYSSFRFKDFKSADSVLDGKQIPGIPRHQGHAELQYVYGSTFAAIQAMYVDSFFVDDANTAKTDAALTVNVRAGGDVSAFGRKVTLFVGVTNLTDQEYVGAARINAFGGRYFEPAPRRSVYGGMSVTQLF